MAGPTKWIVANWKSNKTISEALEWVDQVGSGIQSGEDIKVVVCPNFLALSEVKKLIQEKGYPILIGAQDVSRFSQGPYTGEVAAQDLEDLVDLVIIGHSERRENLNESDEVVEKKVEEVLNCKITPLVCIQEAETPVPKGVNLVAFEPIFAVNSGNADTPENASEVARKVREKYGDIEVLYGGSVTSENVGSFFNQPNLAGVLVGKASLDAEEFSKIIQYVRPSKIGSFP